MRQTKVLSARILNGVGGFFRIVPAIAVAVLYKLRWRIRLFFRWVKGHLRIKHYYGTSPNAVKT